MEEITNGLQPDLLFLDIQMPEVNGLEFSRIIGDRCRTIFTTAFEQYAVDSYRVNALDYLLKPFSYSDFLQACEKARQWFELNQNRNSAPIIPQSIFVKSEYKLIQIDLDKILFIEDVGEAIYRLDRMLTQLSLAGKFDDCAGIVFGDFCDCNKENDDDFEILELIQDRVSKYNKPCIFNLKSGHCTPMITLPFGCKYKLNATEKTLELIK